MQHMQACNICRHVGKCEIRMDYTHIPVVSCIYSDEAKSTLDDRPLTDPEAHFEYEMILITGGSATAVIDHRSYPVGERSLIFISRLERHNFIIRSEPYRRYIATISSELILTNIRDTELISVFIRRPKDFSHVLTLSEHAYASLLPLFARMTEEYGKKPPFYESRSAALVVSVLIELYRSHPDFFPSGGNSAASDAVMRAQRYISDHLCEKITLQDIAGACYVGRHTLSLGFTEIVGIPFKDYLILCRMTEARRLLLTTTDSVEHIAGAVGYTNVNNFIRMFKNREGITPLQYRRHFLTSPTV